MALRIPISTDEIIAYLKSIKEARAEYKAGKTKSHREIFGE
ncbi:hypothetical protein MCHI_002056 [Candidatus Magnetoovum chiemensis]|nr:hypothetical protein MCHI_002056 [Candidatus Magnetoovum chiemensis]